MFTIEHEFDATVITLVDEGPGFLQEDVTIAAFEDCITLEQLDPLTGEPVRLTLSLAQVADLVRRLICPKAVTGYHRSRRTERGTGRASPARQHKTSGDQGSGR